MSPLRRTASIVRDQRGFTLIEMLVAILTGLIVLFATFAILNVSLSQSSRIADRVSADQRSRIAMEKIVQELHSSCVSINENPILAGSEPNKIIFVSEHGLPNRLHDRYQARNLPGRAGRSRIPTRRAKSA